MQTNNSRRTFVDPYAAKNAQFNAKKNHRGPASTEINKAFANFVSFMSISMGVEIHVARNIVRRMMNEKPQKAAKKLWTDPKTGAVLTLNQWETPSQKRARFVRQGTDTIKAAASRYRDFFDVEQPAEVTFGDALDNGMTIRPGGVLWDKFDVSMDTAQKALENKQPAMKEETDEEESA